MDSCSDSELPSRLFHWDRTIFCRSQLHVGFASVRFCLWWGWWSIESVMVPTYLTSSAIPVYLMCVYVGERGGGGRAHVQACLCVCVYVCVNVMFCFAFSIFVKGKHRLATSNTENDILQHWNTVVPCYIVMSDSDSEMNSQRATVCPCGCHHRLAVGSQIASDIRSAMAIELNVTCCAGIAHNKLLAKVVGSHRKPNQQTTLLTCHALALIASLKTARQIPGNFLPFA